MKTDIQTIRGKIIPVLQEEGIVRSSLYGSYVRSEQKDDSDIDILVEMPEGKSLLDLINLEKKLKKVLGLEVDVQTYRSLSPLLREQILNEQQPLL